MTTNNEMVKYYSAYFEDEDEDIRLMMQNDKRFIMKDNSEHSALIRIQDVASVKRDYELEYSSLTTMNDDVKQFMGDDIAEFIEDIDYLLDEEETKEHISIAMINNLNNLSEIEATNYMYSDKYKSDLIREYKKEIIRQHQNYIDELKKELEQE